MSVSSAKTSNADCLTMVTGQRRSPQSYTSQVPRWGMNTYETQLEKFIEIKEIGEGWIYQPNLAE